MANKPRVLIPIGRGVPLGVVFSNSSMTRRKKLIKLSKKIGEKKVQSKLGALAVVFKNTNPVLAAKARADQRFIAARFKGKKQVRFPTGLTRSLRARGRR